MWYLKRRELMCFSAAPRRPLRYPGRARAPSRSPGYGRSACWWGQPTTRKAEAHAAVFSSGLQRRGWFDGRNAQLRVPLGKWPVRPGPQVCGGARFDPARRDHVHEHADFDRAAEGDEDGANRIRHGQRPRRDGPCCEYGAAGRQCDRVHAVRAVSGRQMGRVAQGDRPARDACRARFQSRYCGECAIFRATRGCRRIGVAGFSDIRACPHRC